MQLFAVRNIRTIIWFTTGCVLLHMPLFGQNKKKPVRPPRPVVAQDGKFVYNPEPNGDRIPDFSYCGYMASEKSIPTAPVKVTVPVKPGDATARIQAAIDYVAGLPADANGIKGAVLLAKGTYQVNGSLTITSSGVVLRGSGMNEGGTVLLAAGTDRATFIKVAGKSDRAAGNEIKIADAYVPVNAMKFRVANADGLKAGDLINVRRPCTQEWIEKLDMVSFGGGLNSLGWKPGKQDINWGRKITAVNGNEITIDAPITTALDTAYGGGFIKKHDWSGRITQVGIENLILRSAYDTANPKDEAHRWMAITMENITDGWVRQVTFQHFAGSAVLVLETGSRITVEDCRSLAPVSEIGGQRRNTFWTMGTQTLFQRLYSEYGYHDFATDFCTPGPNAFVQCMAVKPYSFSGAIDSWASGVLFDVVSIDGRPLSYKNREQDGQGAGWAAANSVFWNCTASRIDCYRPPTAQNWSFGSWAQFGGNGYWEESNSTIRPRSFFYTQLADRLGKDVKDQADILYVETKESTSPTPEQAAELMAEARKPARTIKNWVDEAAKRKPIAIAAGSAKSIDDIGIKTSSSPALAPAMRVSNGWLVRGNTLLQGQSFNTPWWNGTVHPDYLARTAKPAITRWVPGKTGTGLTDDLTEIADWMQRTNIVTLEHNYGLWYDRRRDDHERIQREDGDVWAPFYEMPFARSGKETAFDGLSKYDLTKFNPWYWNRLKQFANLADQRGLVLIHHNYFQHNIIEAGAHYTDFMWRTANNINGTGFPEPTNYAGDKRQFMAEQFYDETDPTRRKHHIAYINKCLDNFTGNSGVIQFISEEFTGPLHFAKFWVETIKQWEAAHKTKQLIGLSTTKDVQDAILADKALAPTINIIDIRYWWYELDGNTYAPPGGQSLAPRQQARVFKPKPSSAEQIYRAVREYRTKYPDKAVMFSAGGGDSNGWAVLMAGGSLPTLPAGTDKTFLAATAAMKPVDMAGTKGVWALGSDKAYVIYTGGKAVKVDLPSGKRYTAKWISQSTGQVVSTQQLSGATATELKNQDNGAGIVWLAQN